jgi:hypothetical protein
MRSVLVFDSAPTSLTQIEVLPWEPFERGFLKRATETVEP